MTLTMSQWYAIVTPNGYRCPFCGRYRKRSYFPEQDAAVSGVEIRLELAPACKWCLGMVEVVACKNRFACRFASHGRG